MSYVIMRMKKLKTRASVASSGRHNFRERETPNADESLTITNSHDKAQSTNDLMHRLTMNIPRPKDRRKNAVLAVEYMITASPEWWQSATQIQKLEFEQKAKQFLTEIYGDKNIIQFSIHRDEKTPHVSAIVTPMHEGKLNARLYCGGRAKLAEQQDRIAELMSELGLERGIRGSKAKHKTIQQFYSEIQKNDRDTTVQAITADELKPKKTGFLHSETAEGVAQRINNRLRAPIKALRARSKQLDEVEYENKSLRSERRAIEPYLQIMSTLPQKMQNDLLKQLGQISKNYRKQQLDEYEKKRKQRELERVQRSRDHHGFER
jgi:hypothetical protein